MDIEARQVIPIIGSELAVLEDVPGKPTLYEYLANKLAARLNVPVKKEFPTGYGLLDVASLYLKDPHNALDDLNYETLDILKTKRATPEPLRKLAAITHFDLFVSTTFDSLLQQALEEVYVPERPAVDAIAYSERREFDDLRAEFEHSGARTIYHLFGKLDDSNGDCGLTEEKILEFSHRLQSVNRQPKNLFDALSRRTLLVLGCSLPAWLARFVLRASKGEQFYTRGARGLIADRGSQTDPSFLMFLARRQIAIFDTGDAVQFVNELHRRWMERFGTAAAPSPAPAGSDLPASDDAFRLDSVFISYASDDYGV